MTDKKENGKTATAKVKKALELRPYHVTEANGKERLVNASSAHAVGTFVFKTRIRAAKASDMSALFKKGVVLEEIPAGAAE